MSLESSLQAMAEAFDEREEAGFANAMREVFEKAMNQPAGKRDEAQGALLDRVAESEPALGAMFAVLAGAIVEEGLDPQPLAERLGAPLAKALAAAEPLVQALSEIEPASEDDEDAVWLGQTRYPAEAIGQLRDAMPDAASALRSLDTWFRPVVAAWTRCPRVLEQTQQDSELVGGVKALADASEGARWLAQLLDTVVSAPFVILLPEADAGIEVTLNGVSDCGQLMVLLSEALREPLATMGATVPADEEVLAVMRGDGPQRGHGTYGADFHLYAWRAQDPASKRPANGRFTWTAPGGSGDHSLPGDFQPLTVEALHGRRVLLVLGPKNEDAQWTRVISAARTFEALPASLSDQRALEPEELERWYQRIDEALA